MRGSLPAALRKLDLADFTGAAVLAGLAFTFAAGVVAPLALRDRLAAGRVELDTVNAQRASALTAGLRAAGEQVAALRTRLAAAPQIIRPATALNERLAAVVALAGECGLSVGDFKPGEPTRDPRLIVTPLRIGGDGDFAGVSKFLHRLSGRMPDMAVAGFKLSAPSAGGTSGQYTIDLRWLATADAVAGVTP